MAGFVESCNSYCADSIGQNGHRCKNPSVSSDFLAACLNPPMQVESTDRHVESVKLPLAALSGSNVVWNLAHYPGEDRSVSLGAEVLRSLCLRRAALIPAIPVRLTVTRGVSGHILWAQPVLTPLLSDWVPVSGGGHLPDGRYSGIGQLPITFGSRRRDWLAVKRASHVHTEDPAGGSACPSQHPCQ